MCACRKGHIRNLNIENCQQFTLVQTAESLEELLQLLPNVEYVALDTEADSLHHYYEKVCLIQLSLAGRNFIVDPLIDLDIKPLLELLSHSKLMLHGGEYDLRMLRSSFDYKHKSKVFDTMLAAQILGLEKLGLINLVELVLGLNLSKRGRKSDWSRRPLSSEQLAYACDDTRYLERIACCLHTRLEKLNRLDWHRESCRRMIALTANSRPPKDPDRVWRVKGHRNLNPRQLAVLRSVWQWREEHAGAADLPPFKIVGNTTLIDLAEWSTTPAVKKGKWPRLPRKISGRTMEKLEEAVKYGLQQPDSELPRHKQRCYEAPADRTKVEALRDECAKIASEYEIETSVLAPRSMLEAIVNSNARTVQQIMSATPAMKWQADLISPAAARILGSD